MALNSEQQRVLKRILAIGKQRGATPKEIKAAVETGLVESNLRNLSYGDADSQGWRQERASLYKDPTNLDASISRFYDETKAVRDKYARAGDLAAAVQRPAAQYRGRYHERSGEAASLIGGTSPGSDSEDPPAQTYKTTTTTTPGVDNRQARAQLILSFLNNKNSDPVEFAVQARGLRDVPETTNTVRTPIAGETSTPDAVVPASGGGAFKVEGPNPDRLQKNLVGYARKVADIFGGTLEGKDGSSHSKMTVNGRVSQHFTGNATDIFRINGKPAQGAALIAAGRAALIAAGMPRSKAMKAPGGLYNVGNHQIIFGVNGTQYGGNHLDHLHISAR